MTAPLRHPSLSGLWPQLISQLTSQLTYLVLGLLLGLGLAGRPALAADALNGKSLFLNGPVSGGASCASCHGPSPANNVNGILAAANNPSVISSAFAQNLGGMGFLFNGKFSTSELADLAAFIGDPTVTAVPAASLAPASLTFSSTSIGQTSAALTATLTNTGSATLNVGTITLGGAAAGDFLLSGGSCNAGGTLAPSAGCTVGAAFRPTAAGVRAATISVTHNATGGVSTVSLSGTGNATPQPTIALSASGINFGAPVANTPSAPQTLGVSNSGQAPLVFSAISVGGANAGIFTLGGTCTTQTPVAPGTSCTVTVQAAPSAAGAFSASLTLASNAANGNAVVGLSGSAAAPAPALTATPSIIAFGSQTVGAAAVTQNVTLANSGNVALNLTAVAVSGSASVTIGANNCGASLATGASCVVPVLFAPTAAGGVGATLSIVSNAAPLQVSISGSGTAQAVGAPVLSETGPLIYADTQVGASSAIHTTTFSNAGSVALKIATLTLSGGQPGDFVVAGSCAAGATLSPAASCTIATSFKPTAAGARSADLMLVTDGGAQFHLALSGNGIAVVASVPSLAINPQSFDFGAAVVGGTAPTKRFTLTNSGTAVLTLTSAAFSGPFAAVADSTGCAAFPFTLAPGASCDLVVAYTPAGAGNASGNVVIQSDGAANWTIALAGSGSVASSAAQPSNQGGGGCSAARGGNDPVLALLVALSLVVIGWRRRKAKRNELLDQEQP